MNEETILINAILIHQTDRAILIDHEGIEMWLPKSQIDWWERDEGDNELRITVEIPQWLANDKEI